MQRCTLSQNGLRAAVCACQGAATGAVQQPVSSMHRVYAHALVVTPPGSTAPQAVGGKETPCQPAGFCSSHRHSNPSHNLSVHPHTAAYYAAACQDWVVASTVCVSPLTWSMRPLRRPSPIMSAARASALWGATFSSVPSSWGHTHRQVHGR